MNDLGRKAERPFEIIEVPGEGNCFYHAILATINSSRPILIDHLALRARVAEELTANKAKYFNMFKIAYQSTFVDGKSEVKRYSTFSYEEYVSDQRKEGVYADELAIKALTNVLSMSIRVISSTDGEQIATTNFLLKKPKKMLARITIFNRNNEHFYGCKYLTPPSSRSESRSTNPSASPSRKRRNESRTKTAKSQGENSMDVDTTNLRDEKVSGRNENVIDSNPPGGNNMDVDSDNDSLHTAQDDTEDIAMGEGEENQQKDVMDESEENKKQNTEMDQGENNQQEQAARDLAALILPNKPKNGPSDGE